jgi:hypothetical protein
MFTVNVLYSASFDKEISVRIFDGCLTVKSLPPHFISLHSPEGPAFALNTHLIWSDQRANTKEASQAGKI